MITILDVETTTSNKGDPYDPRNVLCYVGLQSGSMQSILDIEHTPTPYTNELEDISLILGRTDLLVGFNIKFDLAWLRNYGIHYSGLVWDLQYGEYLLSNQCLPWYNNSLDALAARLGLPPKIEMDWSGADTRNIPAEELIPYLSRDLEITKQAFDIQREEIRAAGQEPLMMMHMMDLPNLLDSEYYGLQYDREAGLKRIDELTHTLEEMRGWLYNKLKIPAEYKVNFDSPEHLSAVLFGGTVTHKWKEPYIKIPKTGKQKGQEVVRNKAYEESYDFKGFMKPVQNTKKDGVFSVSKWTLNTLKHRYKRYRELLDTLIMYGEKSLILSTFYKAYEKLLEEHQWGTTIHGQVNQHRTKTGRTSSDRPNQQNQPDEIRNLIRSFYHG